MTRCCIALGANIGDPQVAFQFAFDSLKSHGQEVVARSSSYRTAAMGTHAGAEFQNAAAVLQTDLSPQEILHLLHQIENEFGRERSIRWGPRTLDLDLLFYEQCVLDTDEIVIPHPALWYRRFVLEPLSNIAADWIHPTLKQSCHELLDRLNQLPLLVSVDTMSSANLHQVTTQLSQSFDKDSFELRSSKSTFEQAPFATLFLTEQPPTSSDRRQPPVEFDRSLRIQLPDSDERKVEVVTKFLSDVLTAVLPPLERITK